MQFAVNALAVVGLELLQWDSAIPLEPIRQAPMGRFRSAIALKAAPLCSISALELAHQLGQALASQWEQLLAFDKWEGSNCCAEVTPLPQISVWVQPPGWLFWQWSDGAIAHWLATAAEFTENERIADPSIATDPLPFHLQYAHARCSALLQLAQPLITHSGSPVQAASVLSHLHPAEQVILRHALSFSQQLQPTHAFIATVPISRSLNLWTDGSVIDWPPPLALRQRVSEQWGQQFEQFYSACRVTEVDLSPEHRQVRVQAIAVMKRCLALLLTHLWDADVPEKL